MDTSKAHDLNHALIDLTDELGYLAAAPQLANGAYQEQAISALCRAMALVLRSLADMDPKGEPHVITSVEQ